MGRITVVEKNISEDMIYNWRNELRSHNDGVYVVASSQATKYKSQGFDKSEIVELLAADNFDIDVANRVASNLFNETIVEEIKPVEVAVVPTKYSDCIPVIERTLSKYSAREFVKKLCVGPYSIVKTDEKGLEHWQRIAEIDKPEIKTASKNKYVVAMKKGVAEVDLENAHSSSAKFTEGNYSLFGLADEFIVSAANAVSPYSRLKRALKD